MTNSQPSSIRLPRVIVLERLPWHVRALLGILFACAESGLTYAVPPLRAFPLLLAFPTVIFAAWFLGMWGGILCGVTEAALVNAFLTKEQLRFSVVNAPQDTRLGVFLVLSIFLAWAIRKSAQQRAEFYTQQLQERLTAAIVERELAEERARVNETLRESAKRLGELAAIVDTSDDVILSKDLDGIVTSWNAAATRVFGYTAEEMIGESILTIIPPELHGGERAILQNIREGRRIDHFETVRVAKDGHQLDVSITISPIKDGQGHIVGASKIMRDISSRKRMEDSLLQAEKIAATGRMAATIAHEINNPLEAVMNLLYLLRPAVTAAEDIQYLDSAESELSRVSHIAKQTLGYYREHAAAVTASLSDVVQHAISVYQPRCTASGITIHKALESTRKTVFRRGEMMQVVSNLIVNSIYAMPAGGVLTLSVKDVTVPEQGTLIAIQDTGVGIAPEDLPRVFDAFFTTRTTVGTGIGLFVARQFVEGHGGSIEITSNTEKADHGTTVQIFMPNTTAYDESAPNAQQELTGTPSTAS